MRASIVGMFGATPSEAVETVDQSVLDGTINGTPNRAGDRAISPINTPSDRSAIYTPMQRSTTGGNTT